MFEAAAKRMGEFESEGVVLRTIITLYNQSLIC